MVEVVGPCGLEIQMRSAVRIADVVRTIKLQSTQICWVDDAGEKDSKKKKF